LKKTKTFSRKAAEAQGKREKWMAYDVTLGVVVLALLVHVALDQWRFR